MICLRTTALCSLVCLAMVHPAAAFSTHPEIEVSRTFSPQAAAPDQNVTVTLTVQIGAIGTDPLRGFFFSDQVPAGLAPAAGSASLDGNGLSILRESGPLSGVVSGCTSQRWTLETPPGWPEGVVLPANSSLEISYRITIPADAQPGEISFPGASWVGMQASLGDAGDHFGYQESPATIEVLPEGDDWDSDGMPNDWESSHGLDPENPADASQDPDSDDLSNLEEYQQGTDPNLADSDGDQMPDGWEAGYGLDPTSDDAGADLDVDGYSNLEEYLAGTDPSDPDSHPDINLEPLVEAAADPISGDAPLEVTFSGTASDPDGSIAEIQWQFGDGEASSELNPVHTYTQGDTYRAVLRATDDRGATSEDTVVIMVFDPVTDGGTDAGTDAGADAGDTSDSGSAGGEVDPGLIQGSCACSHRDTSPMGFLLWLLVGAVIFGLRRSGE